MAVQVSYPGVYIDEFTPGAPIVGVGTSIAAFLGPTPRGDLETPTKLTSWEGFLQTFGADPVPGSYLWYAVRGFFENRGTVCYVVRVSNAAYDQVDLFDRTGGTGGTGKPTIHVRARTPGDASATPIRIAVADGNPTPVTALQPQAAIANASGTTIQIGGTAAAADAGQFLRGDAIDIVDGASSESAVVAGVEGDRIRVRQTLRNAHTTGTVELSGLGAGVSDAVRVTNGADLAPGAVVELSQVPAGGPPAPPATTEVAVVRRVDVEHLVGGSRSYRVTLTKPLARAFSLRHGANALSLTPQEFSLTVTRGAYGRTYDALSMDPAHPRYFAAVIGADPDRIVEASLVDPPNTALPPDNRPRATGTTPAALAGGQDDAPATLGAQDYRRALGRTDAVDDINLLVIPDRTDLQAEVVAHCENLQDRFAILHAARGAPPSGAGSVVEQLHGVEGNNLGYAALYYPWIYVLPAAGDQPVLVPPSGHIAGVYARIDARRGVFKAPAGSEAGVNGALGVDRVLTDADQGQLNDVGVNVIRVFRPGDRPVVWGARTTATERNKSWQYVNVRRLFLFLEESIQDGIWWAVFEPNTPALWKRLQRTIGAFLLQQWRDGALFGARQEEAFYVRIDEVLNPDAERALGRLHIEVGARPAYPAEFIILRIGIWQGGSEVAEA